MSSEKFALGCGMLVAAVILFVGFALYFGMANDGGTGAPVDQTGIEVDIDSPGPKGKPKTAAPKVNTVKPPAKGSTGKRR